MTTFLASVVLLLNIWGGLRSGAVAVHEAKEWEDVQVCMRIFKTCEARCVAYVSLRMWRVLTCSRLSAGG